MRGFIDLPIDRRRLVCEQVQEQLGLPAASLEKDFWVCWTLRELVDLPGWGENLTFKGGTSLSKCWELLNRFSEDIDIVIDKGFLGFGGEDSPENAPSKKQTRKRLEAMKQAAQQRIQDELLPALRERVARSLPDTDKWELAPAAAEEDPDLQTLLLHYPTAMAGSAIYVRPVVKIELGARSDNEPVEHPTVAPYLADAFPDILGESKFEVRALAPERTFWEKAMLLHEETYRPPGRRHRSARLARHYYDLWCLITKGIAERAAARDDIFTRAAQHRAVYFRWSWMDYSTLTRGALRIVPPPEQEAEWRRDYRAMSGEMFFGGVPEFDEILRVVREFESAFNEGG